MTFIHHFIATLALVVADWPVFLAILTAFGLAIAPVGHLLSLLPWAWAKALGQLVNGLYSHWGDVIDAIGKLVKALSQLLPKGSGGSAAGIFLIVLCLPCTTSCAAAPAVIKDVASVVETLASLYQSDGGNWLSLAEDAPAALPDSALKSELLAAVAQGRVDLLNASQIVASKGALTQQELDDAFKDFRATAAIVASLEEQLGVGAPTSGLKSAIARADQSSPKPFPLPLAVTNFKGSAQ